MMNYMIRYYYEYGVNIGNTRKETVYYGSKSYEEAKAEYQKAISEMESRGVPSSLFPTFWFKVNSRFTENREWYRIDPSQIKFNPDLDWEIGWTKGNSICPNFGFCPDHWTDEDIVTLLTGEFVHDYDESTGVETEYSIEEEDFLEECEEFLDFED